MILNKKFRRKFYKDLIRKEKFSYKDALKIYEALHREAVSLGVISSKNILEGLDLDLRLSRIINFNVRKINKKNSAILR